MARKDYEFNKDPDKPHVGRAKGTKNKASIYNKQFVQELLDKQRDTIADTLLQLREKDPDAYLRHVKEFMKFVMPTMSAVKVDDETHVRKMSISLDLHEAYEEMKK